VSVCLLELSSGASVSERGGALRLSLGGGADLSTGTRVMGPSSGLCARAAPARHRQKTASIDTRSRTIIFYCNPKAARETREARGNDKAVRKANGLRSRTL